MGLFSCFCFRETGAPTDYETFKVGHLLGFYAKNSFDLIQIPGYLKLQKIKTQGQGPGGPGAPGTKTASPAAHGSSEDGGFIAAVASVPSVPSLPSASGHAEPPAAALETATSLPSIFSRPSSQPDRPSGSFSGPVEDIPGSKPRLRESWDVLVTVQAPTLEETAADVRAALSLAQPSLDPLPSTSSIELPSPSEATEGEATLLQGPLATPQAMLHDIGTLIAVNDRPSVLSALLTLRRGLAPHRDHLVGCLGELLAVVTACLGSAASDVAGAAVAAAGELDRVFGDALLQHMVAQDPAQGLLVRLVGCAAGVPPRPRAMRDAADKVLRRMAVTMHQPSIVRMLEPLAAGGHAGGSQAVKAKAASMLLIATYRLS